MKSFVSVLFALILVALTLAPTSVEAASPQWVVVNWGDTLTGIAARYQTTTYALMRANNLPSPNFIYAGQRLTLPASSASAPSAPNASSFVYVVRPGDMLYDIAARYGTTAGRIAQANSLYNLNLIYSGQRLTIPGNKAPAQSSTPPPAGVPANPAPSVINPPVDGKWIDVNIKHQTITAYEGNTAIKTVLVSTGIAIFPTPVGRFAVYRKTASELMTGGSRASGTYYYLPNVPNVMYFFKDYALHGTYWHHNFGHPMSHGCVNLSLADAKWFYDWTPNGTPVISHY